MMERIRISSSISNFREKLLKRTKLKEWNPWKDLFRPTIFFGAYHWGDWARILLHRGRKTIFFCGSDILALKKHMVAQILIRASRERFICENEVEDMALARMGIDAEILPMIFEDFTPDPRIRKLDGIHVYMTSHEGRDDYCTDFVDLLAAWYKKITFHVYGVDGKGLLKNIIYHGRVSNEQFNQEIQRYHCALRLNEMDGFAETLAKAMLIGQQAISFIPYKHMRSGKFPLIPNDVFKDLDTFNAIGQFYWENKLEENLWQVLS